MTIAVRLPPAIEEFLLDVATDHSARDRRRRLLGFDGDAGMRDAFMEALTSPEVQVHADVCEDDPAEIVVRASGTTASGVGLRDLNVIMLEPVWFDGTVSQDLAEDIVLYWDRLQAMAAASIPVGTTS